MEKNHIHVFRTSVRNAYEINRLSHLLNSLTGDGGNWNFDLEDCDRILRIESTKGHSDQIQAIIKAEGFFIEELDD
ncbi:hypothetical protein JKA74_14265 [Marivirga sp. S37H4]|uniref:Uncharacterized protein n=1 Tax=Marivirga aurantiaca TaxID=2802615 RepID=A0A934X0P4_9BACT|nr:hypothetical protein [Marivirga aurantiaca]MBK6266206.1 hypothetical protein [Marivirga aurantiaca]